MADYAPELLNGWSHPNEWKCSPASRGTSSEILLVAEKDGLVVGFVAFLPATSELTAISCCPRPEAKELVDNF
jgi:hypothetical protein